MSDVTVPGWEDRYAEILSEFGYSRRRDVEAAAVLDSVLTGPDIAERIGRIVRGRTAFVIGSGPSLEDAIPALGRRTGAVRIAAGSSAGPLVERGIIPDIVVTDLDGGTGPLAEIAGSESVFFVVHAHGDNTERLGFAARFRNCMGTTQAAPLGRIRNFGGFTDGDRAVFLASHFGARRIVLFGMDFGGQRGRLSATGRSERGAKLRKLRKGEELLGWLAGMTESELLTTSRPIGGFEKISYKDLTALE